MKRSAVQTKTLLLIAAAALAALAVLLWPGGSQEHEARAYPGLTVAIDMDPVTTTTDPDGDGVYETVDLNTFEDCVDVTLGQQFTAVVSVLDVAELAAFVADIEYDGAVVKIIGSYTGTLPTNLPTMFMSAQTGSDVFNTSESIFDDTTGTLLPPDTDGKYEAGAVDTGVVPPDGDDGSGILVRLTVEAVAPGVSPFNLDSEDIDGDTIPDRGVLLRDVFNTALGDTTGDTWFDGPFVNASANIAVDQPDLDGDGVSDTCDPDLDGDGYCNPGVTDPSCTGTDNCPTISNSGQEDVDGDLIGDVCDYWDADGDGYINTRETAHASNTLDPLSTPEVCDGADNDGDTLIDEGPGNPPTPFTDADADTVPDCVDGSVDTDGDTVPNTADLDMDNDGTTNANENLIATDSLVACHDGVGLDDWPEDYELAFGPGSVDIFDIVLWTPPVFGVGMGTGGQEPFENRKDLTGMASVPDGWIDIFDIVLLTPPVFGTGCS